MAETKKKAAKPAVTRAEKIKRQKSVLREVLEEREWKWNELLEEATKRHIAQYGEEDDIADLKGKIGSAFSLMEEAKEVAFDKKTNICALVKKEEPEQKKAKKTKKKEVEEPTPEKKPRGRKKAEKTAEVAPVVEVNEEKPTEVAPVVEVNEEKPAPKKTVKAKSKTEEPTPHSTPAPAPTPAPQVQEEVKEEPKKSEVIDVSFFLGNAKKEEEKKAVLPEFSFLGNAGLTAQKKQEEKPQEPKKPEPKPESKPESKQLQRVEKKQPPRVQKTPTHLSEDDALKSAFLKKLRSLGGEYFEYYSVYLLERYSLKNGRRLESLKISGGSGDGGIDGELELTDKFGFREVIYIQAKNWDPSKGDMEKWTVGETVLQQFIGAVACRQAKEGKRKCRGIFVTTSRFTEGAKEILDNMSADFIGYDGDEVFETAKECEFGLKRVGGKLVIDEKLLAGEKAFFELL